MARWTRAVLAVGAAALAAVLVADPSVISAESAGRLRATAAPLNGTAAAPSAVVVTAHPDDEVMFFAPTIQALVADGWRLSAVCLSNDGLGHVREKELYESYAVLGVDADDVTLVQHPSLQDGMGNAWEPALIANVLSPMLTARPVDYMLTFDHAGITRHPNHVPLSYAHRYLPAAGLAARPATGRPRLLVLRSPSVLAKFTGPLWTLLYLAQHALRQAAARVGMQVRPASVAAEAGDALVFAATGAQYATAWRAMLRHASQLVWFRWLYMVFSRLVWVNEIVYVGP